LGISGEFLKAFDQLLVSCIYFGFYVDLRLFAEDDISCKWNDLGLFAEDNINHTF